MRGQQTHLDERPAVDGGVAQPRNAVYRTRPRDRQQYSRHPGQEAGGGGGIARSLLIPEANVADPSGLRAVCVQ